MYLPAHFETEDRVRIHALLRAHPLATLVTHSDDGLDANHLPLLFDAPSGSAGVLLGHVARANPLWQQVGAGAAALAIFHGPQAYVSPGWYPSKAAHGRVVPTWNYAVVHVHGRLRAIDDPVWVADLVTRLTQTHEAARPAPWQVSDAPAEFIAAQLRAIVGIELTIERITAKFKLSQNRPAPDRLGVIDGAAQEAAALAALMRE